jgi:hypothetical protein
MRNKRRDLGTELLYLLCLLNPPCTNKIEMALTQEPQQQFRDYTQIKSVNNFSPRIHPFNSPTEYISKHKKSK